MSCSDPKSHEPTLTGALMYVHPCTSLIGGGYKALDDRQILFVVVTENPTGLVDGLELRGRNATEDFDVLKIWEIIDEKKFPQFPETLFPRSVFSLSSLLTRRHPRKARLHVHTPSPCVVWTVWLDDDMPLKKFYQVPRLSATFQVGEEMPDSASQSNRWLIEIRLQRIRIVEACAAHGITHHCDYRVGVINACHNKPYYVLCSFTRWAYTCR